MLRFLLSHADAHTQNIFRSIGNVAYKLRKIFSYVKLTQLTLTAHLSRNTLTQNPCRKAEMLRENNAMLRENDATKDAT